MSTKVSRWRHTTFPRPADASGKTSSGSPSDEAPIALRARPPPRALHFVNTVHPEDATSVGAIGTIRSHVAKEIHATRRQRKRQGCRDQPEAQVVLGGRRRSVGHTDELDAENGAIQRLAQPEPQAKIPSPEALFTAAARRNPLNRLARPLNDVELSLMDYCMSLAEIFGAPFIVQ